MELRRPSILRSGNHTFEYVGFGPGNYSTGLPSVQNRVLTDAEVLLAQSQKEEGGIAFYSGLNSNGDLFIGNTKISSVTGEEADLDTPTLSIVGETVTYVLPSMRLSFVIRSPLNLKHWRVTSKVSYVFVVNLLLNLHLLSMISQLVVLVKQLRTSTLSVELHLPVHLLTQVTGNLEKLSLVANT